MPWPSVEPIPFPPSESRVELPDEAQEASYLAASDRMASLRLRLSTVMAGEAYSSPFVPSTGHCGGSSSPGQPAALVEAPRVRHSVGRAPSRSANDSRAPDEH